MIENQDSIVHLPTTKEELDYLVDSIVNEYNLMNRDHAEAIIINRIMHLPPDQNTTTKDYLWRCITKNLSYQLADSLGRIRKHQSEVQLWVAELRHNPHNQQVFDALEKAANDGSEYAKSALAVLQEEQNPKPPCQVLTMSHLTETGLSPLSIPMVSPGSE